MNDIRLVPGVDKLQQAINEAAEMHSKMASACFTDLAAIAERCARALKVGSKLLFCGNGGSAAESQHFATEFAVRLTAQRDRRALAAMALTTDTSLLTACSNDYGFDHIFSRQVEALMNPGDVLILLSTSGKSPNLILAAKAARKLNGTVISFVGDKETPLDALSDHVLHIPSPSGQRVQEAHLICGHMLVELVEDMLFSPTDLGSSGSTRTNGITE
jgi:D-sedoheptulose 7-phosphate isomerase